MGERKEWLDSAHAVLSLRQQTKLLQINRSSLYYKAVGESEYNIMLMNLLDEQHKNSLLWG